MTELLSATTPHRLAQPILAGWRRLASGVALCVVALVLVLSWLRLFLGIDFTDEAFYVALPYRFALGDVPLRDEQNVGQFAGILILPFVRLFLWVAGGADGIFLYVRHLHLAFTALAALAVFLVLRTALHWRHALLAAAFCLVFAPFNLHSLSYNTLGSGFFTVGCFLALAGRGRRAWGLAGLAHGLAIFVYPTLLPAAAVFPIALLATEDRASRWRLAASYVAGGLLAALLPAGLVLRAGFDTLAPMATYASAFSTQLGGMAKLQAVLGGFWTGVPQRAWWLAGLAALAAWQLAGRPRLLRYPVALLPLLLLAWWKDPNGTDILFMIPALALVAPFVYPLVRQDEFARRLLRLVWLPSFIAGLVTAWSSGNGAANACIGMFPAAIASVVFIQLAYAGSTARAWENAGRETLMLAVPFLVLVPHLAGNYVDYYGDPVHRDKLTAKVESGPYQGIYTQPERRKMILELQRNLAAALRPDDRVLVYNDWTAGYLLAGVRPGVNSVWLPAAIAQRPVSRQSTFDYWRKSGNEPTVVMLMKQSEATPDAMLDVIRGPAFETVADLGIATLRRRVGPIAIPGPAAPKP